MVARIKLPATKARRSKYNAKPTTVDGIRFASKREASRYGELKLMQAAGEISGLQLQPKFELHADRRYGVNCVVRDDFVVGVYIADFSYTVVATNFRVYEDVKGFRTPLYRWKKRHVELEYGIVIVEV